MSATVIPLFSSVQLGNFANLADAFEQGQFGDQFGLARDTFVAAAGMEGIRDPKLLNADTPEQMATWIRCNGRFAQRITVTRLLNNVFAEVGETKKIQRRRVVEQRPALGMQMGGSPGLHIIRDPIGYSSDSFLDRVKRLLGSDVSDDLYDLVDEVVDRAKKGNAKALQNLVELASLDNAVDVAVDAFNKLERPDYLLRLVDPKLEISKQVDIHFRQAVLRRPPKIAASTVVLERNLQLQDEGLRQNAAEGLFYLTTPSGGCILTVDQYWKILWKSHTKRIPHFDASLFKEEGTRKAGWDLCQLHVEEATRLAEMSEGKTDYYAAPAHLRIAALEAMWGAFSGAPFDIQRNIYQKTLKVAQREPNIGWPALAAHFAILTASSQFDQNELGSLLKNRMERWEEGNLNAGVQNALVHATLLAGLKPLMPDSETSAIGRLWYQVLARNPALRNQYIKITMEEQIENRFATLQHFFAVRDHLFFVRSEVKPEGQLKPDWPARRDVQSFLALLRELSRYGVILDEKTVKKTVKGFLESFLGAPDLEGRIFNREVEDFRGYIYVLNSAAAVTAWHEWTGEPWPANHFPHNNRLEGLLASLRWLAQKANEPLDLQVRSADFYWERGVELYGNGSQVELYQDKHLDWWQEKLDRGFPSTATNFFDLPQGTKEAWTQSLEGNPSFKRELQEFSRSRSRGVRQMARAILDFVG